MKNWSTKKLLNKVWLFSFNLSKALEKLEIILRSYRWWIRKYLKSKMHNTISTEKLCSPTLRRRKGTKAMKNHFLRYFSASSFQCDVAEKKGRNFNKKNIVQFSRLLSTHRFYSSYSFLSRIYTLNFVPSDTEMLSVP